MTYAAFSPSDFVSDPPIRLRRTRRPSSQSLLCAAALVLSATVGVGILYVPLHTESKSGDTPVQPDIRAYPATRIPGASNGNAAAPIPGKGQAGRNAGPARPAPYAGLLDPSYTGGEIGRAHV